jgi:glutamate/tyrosine decarboxylase-like PLP-dependent enzyme
MDLPNEGRGSLDPNKENMRRIGYEMVDRIVEHLTTLSDQKVARRGTRDKFAALVDEPLPESPTSISDCMEFFFQRVVPNLTLVNHPRFHAYIPGPSSFAGAIGEMLAAGTNPFAGSWLGGSTISSLELTVLRWIAEMLGYPTDSSGILTSGGSMANLIALATAREKYGRDTLERGVIYISREGHASVDKAAAILGFQLSTIRVVNVDSDFRMRVDLLASMISEDRSNGLIPFFVCCNAGATNTGAIDPMPQLAQLCHDEGLWFHIDAAYGGFAAISETGRELLRGIELGDSITLDPHKWLYCPMGTGCVLVRENALLKRTFSSDADYLKDLPTDEVNFLERGPELSRPARVLAVWMVIRSIGRAELARQIDEDIRLARLAAKLLSEDDRLEVVGVQLSVVTFRHQAIEGQTEDQRALRDESLMETTLASGELMLSSTNLAGKSTLRLVVLNHRTSEQDIARSVAKIRECVV